ncbi:signal transduction histidine kinase [Bacillus mesophilus]|uniref:histidine kinase n=1 Tax=Bacillus mesophilus TaxID=1808955 RepID=A0A6M0Q976_9BACI|nr:ATP-binding protein [Bacillus mesophilus]MBM7662524.1 signal transduction histidine kinase [Bacillus mesophilus]NEY72853.1 sensor histidine kinase [Bacillus mesophilus]
MDSAIYLAIIFIYGIDMALTILFFSSVVDAVIRHKTALWKHLFNFSTYALTIAVAYFAYTRSGGTVGLFDLANTHSYFITLLSYFLCNVLLVGLYFLIATGDRTFSIAKSLIKDGYSTYLVTLALALILTILLGASPIPGLVIFTCVIVSLSLGFREYKFLVDNVTNDKIYREQILNSLPIGIITLDQYKESLTLNTFAKKLLNMDEREVYKAIKKQKQPTNHSFWEFLASEEINTNVKLPFLDDQQSYQLLASQAKLLNHQEDHIGKILYFIDITDVDYLQKRIHQSEKLALLGELSAGAAHEIRNPLTVIKGFITLANEELNEADREKYHIALLLKEFDRINSIIEEMLLIAKPGAPMITETYLQDLLEEIVPLVKESAPSQDLTFMIDLDRTPLHVDAKQITQVIYNLIRNSSEAIGHTGTIRIYSEVDSHFYHLYIEDTGSGIPENLQKNIFDPFLTAKETGTGLGLTIVQRIIENHQGEIKLHSSSENGTTFVITLPLSRDTGTGTLSQ